MADEQQQQFAIQKLFVKDISFESPLGASVFSKQWQPQVKVDINTKNAKLNDTQYEVVLTLTVTAQLEGENAFLIEVQQAGVFSVQGFEGDMLRRVLAIGCPNILFPYAREVIDSLAIKGGFPAMGLQPVNFEAMYMQAMQAQGEQASAEAH